MARVQEVQDLREPVRPASNQRGQNLGIRVHELQGMRETVSERETLPALRVGKSSSKEEV